MFDKLQLTRLKPLLIFFLIYTGVFIIFAKTISYTFPLVAGFLLALLVQPLTKFLKEKLNYKPGIASALTTFLAFIILFGLIFLLGYWLVKELSAVVTDLASLTQNDGTEFIQSFLNNILNQLGNSINKVNSEFIEANQQQIIEIFQNSMGMVETVLKTALAFLTSLPTIFTMLIVMIFSTYFFNKDFPTIRQKVKSLLSDELVGHLRSASSHSKEMGNRYILSYLLIYFITFIETLIVFSILKVPYPVLLSILAGVSDILPVLGPGTIYIPLAVFYLIQGNIFMAVALLIGWILITIVRQIIEPKIISYSINIHPLFMLAAIYFSLIASNFWILLYISSILIVYQIFTRIGALPKFFPEKEKSKEEIEEEEVKIK